MKRLTYLLILSFLCPVLVSAEAIIDYDFNDQSWGVIGHGSYWTMQSSGGMGNSAAPRLEYSVDGTAGKALALNTTSIESNTFWIEFDVRVDGAITGGSKFIKFFGSKSNHSQNNMTLGIDYYSGRQKEVAYYGDTICTARWDGSNGGFCAPTDNLSGTGGAIDIAGGGWGHYKAWVKRADPGVNNGAVKVWWNGILKGDISHMNSNPSGSATDFFETIEFGGYNHSNFSGSWYLWIDNLYVGTTEKNDTPPDDASMPFDLLFEDPIEDKDFSSRGWYDFTNPVLTSTEFVPGSSHALEYHFPENAKKPVNGSAMRKKFTESNAVYVSYYVKYDPDWVGSQKNYHPHEVYLLTNKDEDWSGLAYTNLTAYVEQNALLPRMVIQDSRNIDSNQIGEDLVDQSENRGVAGCNGDSDGYGDGSCYLEEGEYRNGKHWSAESTRITAGVWHKIEAFFKLNSVVNNKGMADGIIKYWLNGNKLIDHQDVMFRTARHGDMKFNQFVIAPWIGDGSPIEQTFWVDHVVIGTELESDSPTCTDGRQNGDETGVDCGGSCDPCNGDTPTCTDGRQNGDETGIDCGGSCEPCNSDTPTCTDGRQNGDETGVDCGGSCEPCIDSDSGDNSDGGDNSDSGSGCFINSMVPNESSHARKE